MNANFRDFSGYRQPLSGYTEPSVKQAPQLKTHRQQADRYGGFLLARVGQGELQLGKRWCSNNAAIFVPLDGDLPASILNQEGRESVCLVGWSKMKEFC